MTVNSLLSERLVSKGSLLSFLNDVYDVGKQTFLRGREVIHLCHQFAPSSLIRRESCLTSSKSFWLKRNKLREELLLMRQHRGFVDDFPPSWLSPTCDD